ncbi:acyl-CoA carboxylase subunit epsilon [Corynebacterium coyleae]|uniref:acyl-CoA carboxylase subunit epsilon n=1 Tax=Corynebacterium coyleae TaxID=53374 RepID=UPI001CCF7CE3|nr:acyl-CoA carboxylase subunit epsilon [Corynebacterium coyleae]UBI08714.1 acyl-CoA carboxylase subunit epsilon [Corynebacterium coyleae]
MDIQVVKGNPTEAELQALTEVLLQLQRERKQSGVQPDTSIWGASHPATAFNPHAFDSAAYY